MLIAYLIVMAIVGVVFGFLSALLFNTLVTGPFLRSKKKPWDIQRRASARVVHLVVSLLGFAIVMIVIQNAVNQGMAGVATACFAISAVASYIASGWLANRKTKRSRAVF